MTIESWSEYRDTLSNCITKESTNQELTDDEKYLLMKAKTRCSNIRNVRDMNICLLFWQMTKNKVYWNYIMEIYNCPLDNMYKYAKIIVNNE